MANIKSSIKRIKTSRRNQIQNNRYRSLVKTFTKQYQQALLRYKNSTTEENKNLVDILLALVYSKIDKAKKVNVLHKNTAARKKSKLVKARTKLFIVKKIGVDEKIILKK